jgi:hypothetical protein
MEVRRIGGCCEIVAGLREREPQRQRNIRGELRVAVVRNECW